MPPDTSFREVRRDGVLRACLPNAYPPLVTGNPDRPGIDVEILDAIAARLDLRLEINRISAMGRDFNPRNWGLTRAQCAVIAGGVVNAPLTRSFLSLGPAYAETGWSALAPPPVSDVAGARIGVLTPITGLDRIALSRFLRAERADVRILHDADDLADAIATDRVALGVTETLLAQHIAATHGWATEKLPWPLPRHALAFGMWKGDLTLKRKIEAAFDGMQDDGTIARILRTYLGATN